ncbi:putative 28S rRNA (cytosine-C(5))-methyltransferase [Binucleata daphniae]
MIQLQNSKFYKECSKILTQILQKKSTLKSEIYKTGQPQRFLAILSQIIKNLDYYKEILVKINLKAKSESMSLIYIHEILNDKLKIKNSIVTQIKTIASGMNLADKKVTTYVRINTLALNNIAEDKETKETKGLEYTETKYTGFENIGTFTSDIEGINTALPFVYKVTGNYNFSKLNSFLSGLIIVQNFSSCLPAFVLNPNINTKVIDACAAPGNKTSHLAAIMNNTGQILAYEKDKRRYEILKTYIKKHNCTNIKANNLDFLETDTETEVDYILVDPSCSASGVHDIYDMEKDRIERLALFQKKILCHSLRYKNVKKIVYSTCSWHREENEDVVAYCLERNTDFELQKINIAGLEYKPDEPVYDFEDKVLRIQKNKEESLQGFFVALFVKKE